MKTMKTEFATIHFGNNAASVKENEPFIVCKGQNNEWWALDRAYSEEKAFGIIDAFKARDKEFGRPPGFIGEYRVFRLQDMIDD